MFSADAAVAEPADTAPLGSRMKGMTTRSIRVVTETSIKIDGNAVTGRVVFSFDQ
jgi:hypothetical protein